MKPHVNLRLGADGEMEFLTRPVAPYLVDVPGLTRPDIPVGAAR